MEAVLDVNSVDANSGLVSIGQVRISPDQQLVAYTLSAASGAETYDAHIRPIGECTNCSLELGWLELELG